MKKATKHLLPRWPLALFVLALAGSFPASAHDHDDGYWRPYHHHHHGGYGWRPSYYYPPAYYAPPPPPRYVPPPPPPLRYAPPPVVVPSVRLNLSLPLW